MSSPVNVLRVTETIGNLIQCTQESAHHGYPVVDDYDPAGYDLVSFFKEISG